jgi:anti-sigma B factor antagonist
VDVDSPSLRSRIEHDDAGCTLTVAGDVDLSTSPQLQRALDEALETVPMPTVIRADLTAVRFLDTLGLGLLLSARSRAEALGSRFVVSSTSPALDRLFAVTGVAAILRDRD